MRCKFNLISFRKSLSAQGQLRGEGEGEEKKRLPSKR